MGPVDHRQWDPNLGGCKDVSFVQEAARGQQPSLHGSPEESVAHNRRTELI
jgi:hypothetical protein